MREFEDLNNSEVIKSSDTLVTIDVSSLYTNIDQSEGIDAVKEALEERSDKKVPTNHSALRCFLTCYPSCRSC